MDISPDTLRWIYAAIIIPIVGLIGGWFHSVRKRKRRKKAILSELSGLPPEAKAVLIDFYNKGAHTLRGDPLAPVIKLLSARGILSVGPGGGGYDAVDRYLSIRSEVWEIMPDWILIEPNAAQFIEQFPEE